VSSRRWLYVLACLLLLPGLAGLSGSSYLFSAHLDPLLTSAERTSLQEVLGRARGIRSDEYNVTLPSVRAQQESDPSFPLVNLNEGLGQFQRNSAATPVLDWGIAFRPLLWPLLLRTRWSEGVHWFLRMSLFLLSLFLLFSAMTEHPGADDAEVRRRSAICAIASIAVLFSSALSWWLSTGLLDMAVYSGLAVAGVAVRQRAATARLRVLSTLGIAYATTCFFFVFYPPSWAPFIWLMGGAAFDLHRRKEHGPVKAVASLVPLLAILAIGALLGLFYSSPYLALVSHTAYPGNRIAAAGQLPVARLLDMILPSHDVWAPLRADAQYLGRIEGMNVCEASAVEVPPFFLLLAMAVVSPRVRNAARAVACRNAATLLVWVLLGAWMFVPLPRWFGAASLLQWSPAKRVLFPFGVTTAILGAAFLAELAAAKPQRRSWRQIAFGLVALAAVILLARRHLDGSIPIGWTERIPLLLLALTWAAGLIWLHDQFGARIMAWGWALSLLAADVGVNPLMRSRDLFQGGAGYAALQKALAAEPGRIVDYSLHFGNAMAGYGLPVLDAVQFAPDLGLYRFLTAGSGVSEELFNRFSIVTFALPSEKTALLNEDFFQVAISPCSKRLAALGVNHLVLPASAALPVDCSTMFKMVPAGDAVLWSRAEPVCPFGVAQGARAPTSAEDFDFRCASVGSAPRLEPRRSGFDFEVPARNGFHFALPINTSVIGETSCTGAALSTLDAHLIVSPTGAGPARCSILYLDSFRAISRLLQPAANARAAPNQR